MQSDVLQQWAAARTALVARLSSQVVGVRGSSRRNLSGIVWEAQTVVSAAEPLAGAQQVTVQGSAGELVGEVLAVDLATDVAIIRAPGLTAAAAQRSSAAVQAGEPVVLAGRAGAHPRAKWSDIDYVGPSWISRRGGEIARAIGVSGALPDGLEGGAVFQVSGELIAMAVTGPRGRTLGIPVQTISAVAELVRARGYLPQPYLGLSLQSVWLDHAQRRWRTAVITGIEPASPAGNSELRVGDLVLGVGAQVVNGPIDVLRMIRRAGVGGTLSMELLRAGERREAIVAIGERPRA